MAQEKPAKNKAKPQKTKKARGVYATAAQTRQNRLNKALGDTGANQMNRKKFGGKTEAQRTKGNGSGNKSGNKQNRQGDKKK